MGYVYILQGKRKKNQQLITYTGSTLRTFEERFAEHRAGQSQFTAGLTELKPWCVWEVAWENTRAVEAYLKRCHDVARHFGGLKPNPKMESQFNTWIIDHRIKIKEVMRDGHFCGCAK